MSTAPYRLPHTVFEQTFAHFRRCGKGRRECQTLWLSPWDAPATITKVIHPKHEAHAGGFVLDTTWLNEFWLSLARENLGIRVQIHTHPGEAFHSSVDDRFPIIHTADFLSLVIPRFALGPIGFEAAYLTELQEGTGWRQVPIEERLVLI